MSIESVERFIRAILFPGSLAVIAILAFLAVLPFIVSLVPWGILAGVLVVVPAVGIAVLLQSDRKRRQQINEHAEAEARTHLQ